MNRVFALLWKDLRLFVGDRKALLITFLVPIGIASFFGMIFGSSSGGDVKTKKVPVLVVDQDQSPLVAKIVEGLKNDSMADPTLVDERTAQARVKEGKAAVAVLFPKGFAKDAPQAMFDGTAPTVELRYDPSKNLEMQAVQGSIMQVAMGIVNREAFAPNRDYTDQIGQIERAPGLSPAQKADFRTFFADLRKINAAPRGEAAGGQGMQAPFVLKLTPLTASQDPDAEKKASLAHTFAGMAMQGVLFFAINAAMGMLTDRRMGIWRRLRASPVTLGELLVGKALSTAIIGGLVLVGVLVFGMAVFGMRVSGSWLGLTSIVVATALMTSAFGLLVASLGRTEEQSRGLSTLAVLAMVMLGGAWFPSFMMPMWVQKLSLLVPVRWALDGFDSVLWRGEGVASVVAPLGALLAFTMAFGAVAAFRFRTLPESA